MARAMAEQPVASLPMYDWTESRTDWDEFWRLAAKGLARQGIEAPPLLVHDDDPWRIWRDPGLVLGQTCGWPFVSGLRETVAVVGRFDFGLETARPGDSHSVFVTRRAAASGEPAEILESNGTTIAVNEMRSQSGWRALATCLDLEVEISPDRIVLTGGHRESIRAVAAGAADMAAIDAHSWALARRFEPASGGVMAIGRSPDMPGLPLITSRRLADAIPALIEACASAVAELPPDIAGRLGIQAVVAADDADYDMLARPPYGRLVLAGGNTEPELL